MWLQRTAQRSAQVTTSLRMGTSRMPTIVHAQSFSTDSSDSSSGMSGDVDPFEIEEDEFDSEKIFGRRTRPYAPRRPTMPEGAKTSRFMMVKPEHRGKMRRHLLEEFKKDRLDVINEPVDSHVPDADMLAHLREMGKNAEEMTFADDDDEDELNLGRLGLLRQIVHVDRVQKVVAQGKILTFRALVVVGNMRGCAGHAVGRGSDPLEAVLRGTKLAMKRFTYIDRFDDRTLYHEVKGKWNSSTLFIRPAPKGKGETVSDTVGCVLDCFGITDVVSKCHGQRNPFTVIKATFNALSKHQTAEELALKTGHSLVEMANLARTRNL